MVEWGAWGEWEISKEKYKEAPETGPFELYYLLKFTILLIVQNVRIKWHRICIPMISIGVPTFLVTVFCSTFIGAIVLLWLAALNAVAALFLSIMKETSVLNIVLEIVHNAFLVLSVLIFGTIIGLLLQSIANEKS